MKFTTESRKDPPSHTGKDQSLHKEFGPTLIAPSRAGRTPGVIDYVDQSLIEGENAMKFRMKSLKDITITLLIAFTHPQIQADFLH